MALALQMWPLSLGEVQQFSLRPSTKRLADGACSIADGSIDSQGAFRDLEAKGYAVFSGFASALDLETLSEHHWRLPQNTRGTGGKPTGLKSGSLHGFNIYADLPHILTRIQQLTAAIQTETNISISTNTHTLFPTNMGVFYHTNATIPQTLQFPWHQDPERYWSVQDHYNCLNFIVYVDKPNPVEAGIEMVPFDWLREVSPQFHDLSVRAGARSFLSVGPNGTLVLDNEEERFWRLDFHLDNISCAPRALTGDLLVARCDTIHRTQPHRSAISWRTSVNSLIAPEWGEAFSLGKLLRGGMGKYFFLSEDPRWANKVATVLLLRLARRLSLSPDTLQVFVPLLRSVASVGLSAAYLYRRLLKEVRCGITALILDGFLLCYIDLAAFAYNA